MRFVILVVIGLWVSFSDIAKADTPNIMVDIRYQGSPVRGADGKILRSKAVLYAFKKVHPCPATLSRNGACSGWAIDHVIPLECGGIDAVWNLQWLPISIKSGTDDHDKDRFERKIYAHTPPFEDTSRCVNEVVP